MLDTLHSIETPEGTDLTVELAGPVVRILAFTIDFLIRFIIQIGGLFLYEFLDNTGIGIYLIAIFLLEWFYPVVFEVYANGMTPGKKLMGIKVIQDDGTPVRWSSSLIRNLFRFVDFLPMAYITGIMTMVLSGNFKRLGDLAAGTFVVYHLENAKIPTIPKEPPRLSPIPLTLEEQRAVLDFAERHNNLSEDRSRELARILQPIVGQDNQAAVKEIHKIANGLLGER